MAFLPALAAAAAPAAAGATGAGGAAGLGAGLSSALGAAAPAAAGAAGGATALGSAMPWLHAAGSASAGLPAGATAMGGAMPWLQGAGGASQMGLSGMLGKSLPSMLSNYKEMSQTPKSALEGYTPPAAAPLQKGPEMELGGLMGALNQRAQNRQEPGNMEQYGGMDLSRLMDMYNRNQY